MKLPFLIFFIICNLILLGIGALAGGSVLAYAMAALAFGVQAAALLWTHNRATSLVAQLIQVFD